MMLGICSRAEFVIVLTPGGVGQNEQSWLWSIQMF